MQPTARSLLGGAFHDLRRTYTHMVLTDLLARVLGVALIAPLVGLLLQVFLSAQAGGVVSDTAIVAFFLHPLGILALLVVGGASLAVLFAETSQLMVIGFGALEDRRVTWLDALLYAARRAWACLRLAWLGLGKLLLIAAPFLLAVGGIYLLVASKHDINHYLANMPPAFVAGLWGAGLLLAVLTVLVIQRIARWLIALPMVLFENTNPREALHRSWELTAPHRVRLTLWLLGWVLAVIVLGAIVTFLVSALGNLLVPYGSDRIHLTLLMLTLVLLVSFVANVMVSIFAAVLFPSWWCVSTAPWPGREPSPRRSLRAVPSAHARPTGCRRNAW